MEKKNAPSSSRLVCSIKESYLAVLHWSIIIIMKLWVVCILALFVSLGLADQGHWCFSGFLSSNPQRDLLSFVPADNTTSEQAVWTSSPKTILAIDVEPSKRYLYLISTDVGQRSYELEKYSLESGVQIQARVLSVPSGTIRRGVPFCVSSKSISVFYDGTLHRFSLADLQEQRQNLPPFEDEVWLACSENTTFISAYEHNQVWFVDANGENGFMSEVPLFVPSPTALFYEAEQDTLYIASGRPLVEVYSYSVQERTWGMTVSFQSDLVLAGMAVDMEGGALDGFLLSNKGDLFEVDQNSTVEQNVWVVLPSNDAARVLTVNDNNLVSEAGDWNNKGNLGSVDYISVKPCVSNMEKMFLKSNKSLGSFRISPARGEAVFLDGFDLGEKDQLLAITGSCTDPLVWWRDENGTVHVDGGQEEETSTFVTQEDKTSHLSAYDENTWCFVGGNVVQLACFGVENVGDIPIDFVRGTNQRVVFLAKNVMFALWQDTRGKQGVYNSLFVAGNWTSPVWLADGDDFLEVELLDERIISFRTNSSGIFMVEPGQDRVFYFPIASALFPFPMQEQGTSVCLNFTSIVLPFEPDVEPGPSSSSPDFIGSLPLFIVSVFGLSLCCFICICTGCFLAFYRTKRSLFKSANFRYRQQKFAPERHGELNMKQQFSRFLRECMWGCLGKCSKNWRDKNEIRMQDREYVGRGQAAALGANLLLEEDDFREADAEEDGGFDQSHDATRFDTIPLERHDNDVYS